MSIMTTAARWISGRAKLASDLPAAEARLADIEANPPQSAEPTEHLEWAEKRDAARREVEALRGALAIATAEAAKAEAAQAEADDDQRHVDTERQAKADEKLVRELDALLRKAAAKRDELAASVARTAEANEKRGSRPFILDAERRARETPGRDIPAEFVERECWRDGSGREATVLRQNERGEMVPTEAGFTKVRERVQVRPERRESATMPRRYVDALVLVDMQGRPL